MSVTLSMRRLIRSISGARIHAHLFVFSQPSATTVYCSIESYLLSFLRLSLHRDININIRFHLSFKFLWICKLSRDQKSKWLIVLKSMNWKQGIIFLKMSFRWMNALLKLYISFKPGSHSRICQRFFFLMRVN